MAKYLDSNGLLYLWQKIKSKFVEKEAGKGLSTNDFTTEEKTKLSGIASGAQVNVKPDWNAGSDTASGILNKPSIPSKVSDLQNDSGYITIDQVPEGAVASATTPLMNGVASVGSETAFARGDHVHPSDTSKADKATTLVGYGIKDAYTKAEVDGKGYLVSSDISGKADKSTTLSGYGITDAYTRNEIDSKGYLVSGDIANKADKSTTLAGYGITNAYTKTEVDGKLSSVYKPAGNCLFANLPVPGSSNLGNVYNMMDAFTTDDRFIASTPASYPIGTNVVVIQVENSYYFDVLAGFVDLSGYLETTDVVAIANQEIDEIVA